MGPKRDEVPGNWRRLHSKELLKLYILPNIIRIVRSMRMKWAGVVARMGTRRIAESEETSSNDNTLETYV